MKFLIVAAALAAVAIADPQIYTVNSGLPLASGLQYTSGLPLQYNNLPLVYRNGVLGSNYQVVSPVSTVYPYGGLDVLSGRSLELPKPVEDTAEVKAAKLQFLNTYQQVASRGKRDVSRDTRGILYPSTSIVSPLGYSGISSASVLPLTSGISRPIYGSSVYSPYSSIVSPYSAYPLTSTIY